MKKVKKSTINIPEEDQKKAKRKKLLKNILKASIAGIAVYHAGKNVHRLMDR